MSNAATVTPASPWTGVRRYFRKPKGLLILILGLLAVLAGFGVGPATVAPGLVVAMIAAAVVDAPILRLRNGKWSFPDGALLTGMIVGMILSPLGPWYVPAVTSVAGVVSKYVFRTRTANIFNPAALALIAAYYLFDSAQDWWGALPDATPYALVLLFAAGLFITDRVNKLPLLLSFLGGYYLLFTLTAFFGDPRHVAEIFRLPDLNEVLFFAFFMLTDPPTSPPQARDQIIFGLITAAVSYGFFVLVGAVYYLLAGLMVANLWEALRRVLAHSKRHRKLAHDAHQHKLHASGTP